MGNLPMETATTHVETSRGEEAMPEVIKLAIDTHNSAMLRKLAESANSEPGLMLQFLADVFETKNVFRVQAN